MHQRSAAVRQPRRLSAAETDALVEDKRIVAVDVPAGRSNARLKRYRIADPYLRFWFRFVEPQLRIEVGRVDLALAAFHSSWATWRGKAIEPLVRQAVLRLVPSLRPPFETIESVDAWWDRRGSHEYDLVGSGHHDEVVAVGSIKWGVRGRFDRRDLAEVAEARSIIPRAAASSPSRPEGVAPGVEVDLVLDAATF